MTWAPDDALVEKAARAAFDVTPVAVKGQDGPLTWGQCGAALKKNYRDEARAALIACRDDMVAEAVRAEAEAIIGFLQAQRRHAFDEHTDAIDCAERTIRFIGGRHP